MRATVRGVVLGRMQQQRARNHPSRRYQKKKSSFVRAVSSSSSSSIASVLLSLDEFAQECLARETDAANAKRYDQAEKFRLGCDRAMRMKEELAREIEREVVSSGKREHATAARARKKIDEMTREFQLYREEIFNDDDDNVGGFSSRLSSFSSLNGDKVGNGDAFNACSSSSSSSSSSVSARSSSSAALVGGIQTNFYVRKDDCDDENGRRVRLVGSCEELGEWDVQRSLQLERVDEKDDLYACSLDMSAKTIDDGFKFKFFTCAKEKVEDIDWQTCEDAVFRNAIDGSGETIALNFTVDWMGNGEKERVWVCQTLER